jgi:hypothetical protein
MLIPKHGMLIPKQAPLIAHGWYLISFTGVCLDPLPPLYVSYNNSYIPFIIHGRGGGILSSKMAIRFVFEGYSPS